MEQQSVNALRVLGIDAIEKSNSGHPGIVMGAAPMAYTLWSRHLRVNPNQTDWMNRDRFVLSAGHGSMLLYGLLHLSGFDVTLDDIQQFRQWDSKTPGHPEFGHTAGIDATTGPLGQGIAMAVGMATAEKHLAALCNKPDYAVIDHFTYVICGDGDLMEGISSEASSFAGLQKLGKLVVLYDSNDICLDGTTSDSFTENVRARYDAYGWQTILVEDGNDIEAIDKAIIEAKKDTSRPTLIEVKTVIGFGADKKAGSNSSHGAPLGAEEATHAKAVYGWTHAPFVIPEEVYADYRSKVAERGTAAFNEWQTAFAAYTKAHPEAAELLTDSEVEIDFPDYEDGFSQATRNSSQDCINQIAAGLPTFFGGSADLAHSNMTYINGEGLFNDEHPENRNIQFGVREFAMGAILNGMSLHGGLKVYGGTFFVFSDYLKAAMRLSSLMHQPVTYVLTHDSVAVGEDGATHEPIEQLAMLRSIPNMNVIRPADARETLGAWRIAIESEQRPTSLILTRQNLTVDATDADEVAKGAYIVHKEAKQIDAILIASGSEVNLALAAARSLAEENIDVRVVSMPSMNLFDEQSDAYKEQILPSAVRARVAIEMASSFGWHKYVGLDGAVVGIDRFGASAPAAKIIEAYGFTVENVAATVKNVLK
ncbi:transketolase [Culicoidibacter larvae]|uniref:Transketolase n=1 Tax=Culicoidibacter larvae TaxID=2579976 RepID=A0A5R8QDI4_9FIRM|nr:transketolase [Culicoidibacter larvae]